MKSKILSLLCFFVFSCVSLAAETNPFIGTWVVDVPLTKQHRKDLDAVPPGLVFKPTPEEVVSRTMVFTEKKFRASAKGTGVTSDYEIVRSEGRDFLIKYTAEGGSTSLYCWWSFTSPSTAISYVATSDASSPILESKLVATFYNKEEQK